MRNKPRIFYGKTRQPLTPQPDPYGPSSPGYAERNRRTEVEVSPGMVVVSLGAPIQRLAGEAQPVDRGTPEVAPAVSEQRPEEAFAVFRAEPAEPSRPRSWRDDYGLAKRA